MSKRQSLLPICALALLSLADGASANAPTPAPRWMPDVAARRAELLGRYERFASETRTRELERAADGQWWRRIAARPVPRKER